MEKMLRTISPKPKVAMARYRCEKRSTGRPISTPTTKAASAPHSTAGTSGQAKLTVSTDAVYAPTAMKPPCPTENWPVASVK